LRDRLPVTLSNIRNVASVSPVSSDKAAAVSRACRRGATDPAKCRADIFRASSAMRSNALAGMAYHRDAHRANQLHHVVFICVNGMAGNIAQPACVYESDAPTMLDRSGVVSWNTDQGTEYDNYFGRRCAERRYGSDEL
jgi:hypothetical protein